ncbi:hypothetical protein CPCC7001_565 [Cyanobium sp. PCC 7001]|uniref:hypothetical protein n=1 Tax=Cyanobium sp. PCC 7001 TaxID=180281 RepID=UPI00018056A3|nr:hypothetical protein [Cyanobium sp. PCC 7001]EDY37686.1 hypothetical protein CPCC7001_565 [Cyanobium sp. PCC 7001]
MGRIADTLRQNLRTVAQSDARSLRALDAELQAASLHSLTNKQLQQRCKALGLRGYSRATKDELVALLSGTARSEAIPPAPAPAQAPAAGQDLASLHARLERLEALLEAVARRVGLEEGELRALRQAGPQPPSGP